MKAGSEGRALPLALLARVIWVRILDPADKQPPRPPAELWAGTKPAP